SRARRFAETASTKGDVGAVPGQLEHSWYIDMTGRALLHHRKQCSFFMAVRGAASFACESRLR
ncbi:MAG: hypothetical protein ACJ79N_04865, partial [Gemmatimonadaceae bacterium]